MTPVKLDKPAPATVTADGLPIAQLEATLVRGRSADVFVLVDGEPVAKIAAARVDIRQVGPGYAELAVSVALDPKGHPTARSIGGGA